MKFSKKQFVLNNFGEALYFFYKMKMIFNKNGSIINRKKKLSNNLTII